MTLASAVSRGTERLVFEGRVPASEQARMRAPHQAGEFPFPVKYGYALVGRVEAGPEALLGQTCFALHPHQDRAVLPAAALTPLPSGLAPQRAVLAANMETALTVLWDSGISGGDRVLVVGAGVVGLLIAALAARVPGTQVTVVDRNPNRAGVAAALGVGFADTPPEQMDVAINASAAGEGLRLALGAAGLGARVVEASWHGDADVALPLGGGFHANRLQIVSSQVGAIPPDRAPRWTHARRLQTALRLLADWPALDALITHRVPFAEAPSALPPLLDPASDVLCCVLTYGDA
ncbi:MAG: zinc-binding alcohol dehydrogenase [Pseudomonadota bacterium]